MVSVNDYNILTVCLSLVVLCIVVTFFLSNEKNLEGVIIYIVPFIITFLCIGSLLQFLYACDNVKKERKPLQKALYSLSIINNCLAFHIFQQKLVTGDILNKCIGLYVIINFVQFCIAASLIE